MKLLKLMLPLAFVPIAFAGGLYQHIQLPLLDAYVDSSTNTEADIPGMGKVTHSISVSISTIDGQTAFFAIYLRVLLQDGTSVPIKATLTRGDGQVPATAVFPLGDGVPVRIESFYVVRMHAEPSDNLVTLVAR